MWPTGGRHRQLAFARRECSPTPGAIELVARARGSQQRARARRSLTCALRPPALDQTAMPEPGVGVRRYMGGLPLHAGKYILGTTASTGTGVQALPRRESSRKFFRLYAPLPSPH
jgi:hypothetical protein